VDFGHNIFVLGEWQVDPQHNVLIKESVTTKIEKRLTRVLLELASSSPQVVTKEQILQKVWQGKVVSDETISVAISRLRKALGCNAKNPIYIETITGVGFRLLVSPKSVAPCVVEIKSKVSNETANESKKNRITNWYTRPIFYIGILVFISLFSFYQSLLSINSSSSVEQEKIIKHESYAKALFLLQKDIDGIRQAEILLTQLNQQYPNNALVINSLGKAKYFQLWYSDQEKQKEIITSSRLLFEQAIEINPEFGDPYLQLALIAMVQDRNFSLAEEYFIKSITFNPEQVTTHIEYAGMLLSQRRFDKAVHHNKIAQSIDPQHYSSASIEWIYNMAERYEQAEKELAKLFTIDPESAIYNTSAIRLYESLGDEDRAYIHYRKAFQTAEYSEQELIAANNAFEQGGLKHLNYWLVNVKQEQGDIGQYIPPISTARYHIAAGELDKALTILEQAHKDRHILTLWVNSDPKYKPVRDLPRFKKLIKNIEKTIK